MATSNKMRALNRLPYDFEDGLKVKGIDLSVPGGAAGVIYDTDNMSVQTVLDNAKPLANYEALRAYNGRATQIRITDPAIAGFFYKVTPGSVDDTGDDNGGTIIRVGSTVNGSGVITQGTGARWKRVFDGSISVRWFGAKGDGVTDDTAAIQLAADSGKAAYVPKPASSYRLTAPINITTNQKLFGLDAKPTFTIAHSGAAFQITDKGHLENVAILPASGFTNNFTGVLVGSSKLYNTHGTLKELFIANCLIGIELRGGCYFYNLSDINVYNYRNYGVLLSPVVDGGGTYAPNNNYVHFKTLSSNTPAPYDPAKWASVTWEQAAIKVSGSQNYFIGGEPSIGKYGAIVDVNATLNRFVSMYLEWNFCPLKAGANTYTIWDSSAPDGGFDLDANAIVVGQGGQDVSRWASILQKPISLKDAKGVWFFDEGYGSTVYDRSGAGNNLTLTNPVWDTNGKWGNGLRLDVARTNYINNVTLDSVDWTQPFTIAMCYKVEDVTPARQTIMSFTAGSRYAAIGRSPGDSFWTYYDFDSSTVTLVSIPKVRPSRYDGFSWAIIYFDPVNKILSNIDPFFGLTNVVADADAPRFAPWVTGGGSGVTKVQIMQDAFNQQTQGYVSFFGIWQRKLTLPEASHLVNMKTPTLQPSGVMPKIAAQANSVAADVTALRTDLNSLMTKMRDAGILKT